MRALFARKHARLSIGIVALVVFPGIAGAIAPQAGALAPQELPSAAEVTARHVAAIGGREAIEGHSSSVATGTLELVGQGLVGSVTIYAQAPDKNLIIIDFPDAGMESRVGYDGNIAWSIDPMMGERLLQGGELQQTVDEADYYSDLYNPDNFESMETVEVTEFSGREAYRVRLVYKSGRETFEYFDVETGRLIGSESVQESFMGAVNVVMFIQDYQQFEDIMVPTKIVQEVGTGQTVQVSLETIEFDNLDPAMFDLPASIQALIRN